MIAIALFINLLSHISCQQTQEWPSYLKPSEMSVAIGNKVPGAQNVPNFLPFKNNPQLKFPSSQLNQTSNLPSFSSSFLSTLGRSSSFKPVTTSQNTVTSLSPKISEISSIPQTTSSNSKPKLNSKPITYTVPPTTSTSQIIQTPTQISSLAPSILSTSSVRSSLFPKLSPSITPSFQTSVRTPRRTIPSPLIESTLKYPNEPFRDIFELPEPSSLSVGCLDLTMTPYGTISETSLLDPSIPLPRSPFLPVSSPVSAFAPPFSPHLPPASPATRTSTFLRKVPFPPPFI